MNKYDIIDLLKVAALNADREGMVVIQADAIYDAIAELRAARRVDEMEDTKEHQRPLLGRDDLGKEAQEIAIKHGIEARKLNHGGRI